MPPAFLHFGAQLLTLVAQRADVTEQSMVGLFRKFTRVKSAWRFFIDGSFYLSCGKATARCRTGSLRS
jgi:hypothetical protein